MQPAMMEIEEGDHGVEWNCRPKISKSFSRETFHSLASNILLASKNLFCLVI